jgi:trk system potassium uptake protein
MWATIGPMSFPRQQARTQRFTIGVPRSFEISPDGRRVAFLRGRDGIDTVVSPRAITVSTILQHVRRGRIRAAHSLSEGLGEVIEAEVLETSALAGRSLREAGLPEGVVIGALVRDDGFVVPRGGTVIRSGDLVVLFAKPGAVKKVERLFSVKLEFF